MDHHLSCLGMKGLKSLASLGMLLSTATEM
jgi:hypothetical protein